jgi:hypothetical protein
VEIGVFKEVVRGYGGEGCESKYLKLGMEKEIN